MKLLLDTHTFIWWDSDPKQLSETALTFCNNPQHELILSVASMWELQIKHQINKLQLRMPLFDIVAHQQIANGLTILPIMPNHIFALN